MKAKRKDKKGDGLQRFFDACPNAVSVSMTHGGKMCFDWSQKGFGFGQLYLWVENGKLHKDTECSSDELMLEVLRQALAEAVDTGMIPYRPKRKKKK